MKINKPSSLLSSEVERVAFNHVVVGSIPTDGDYVSKNRL